MVLAQLGGSISRAIQQMSNATIIDEKVLNECLNEITRALLQSDVQFKLVRDMQTNIKKIVNLDDLAAGHNKRKIIQQVIAISFRFISLFIWFFACSLFDFNLIGFVDFETNYHVSNEFAHHKKKKKRKKKRNDILTIVYIMFVSLYIVFWFIIIYLKI